jgi:hypothetical protein
VSFCEFGNCISTRTCDSSTVAIESALTDFKFVIFIQKCTLPVWLNSFALFFDVTVNNYTKTNRVVLRMTDFFTKQIFLFLQERLGALSDDGLTLNVRVAVLYGVVFLAWFLMLLPISHFISLAVSRTYRNHGWTPRIGWLSWCLSMWHSPVSALWALNGELFPRFAQVQLWSALQKKSASNFQHRRIRF